MKDLLYASFKTYISSEFIRCRSDLSLTQEEMAHLLGISTRAYISLESGESCCGVPTLLSYLYQFRKDYYPVLSKFYPGLAPHPEDPGKGPD